MRSAILFALFLVFATSLGASEVHPRLFVDESRLQEIRLAAAVADSHHQRALDAMRARVDSASIDTANDIYGDNLSYSRAYFAREAAFLSLIITDDSAAQAYAELAYDALDAVYNGSDPDRYPDSGKGLARAMMCFGFAMAYDWCYERWDNTQREWVRSKLIDSLDAWTSFSHPNVEASHRGSNWVAVCRSGELVAMLATYEESLRSERHDLLIDQLQTHMETAYGNMGVTQEGLGYMEYGGAFLATATLATQHIGNNELWNHYRQHDFHRTLMYSHTFQHHAYYPDNPDGHGKIQQQGVAWSGYFEGFASLNLPMADADEVGAAYRYWYDHHLGVNSSLRENDGQRFDHDRAATVWSLIYYDEDGGSTNPSTTGFGYGVVDDHGYSFWRNRWQDANDIQIGFHGDGHRHGKAWDQSEAGALTVMAYNTRFFGGPNTKGDPELYSMLLIDGEDPNNSHTGMLIEAKQSSSGGYVLIDGDVQYQALGIHRYQRHCAIEFNGDNRAFISTLDDINASESHTYTWNANLEDNRDEGIPYGISSMSAASESGRTTFLLEGQNGGWMKGWVMHPADATVDASDPLSITTTGSDARIWVVMLVGSGTPPTGSVNGSGMEATLVVDGRRISYEGGRIHYADPAANRAPLVDIEAVATINFTGARASTQLSATVSDDDLPSTTAPSLTWSVVSGPGTAYFDQANQRNTRVSFDRPGTWILQLQADDGNAIGSDHIVIEVQDTETIAINFQSEGSPIPNNYLPDYGEIYGSHNSLEYGWSVDQTSESRDRGAHADQRYDTLVHAKEATWDIALKDGTYHVYLVCGDSSHTDSVNTVAIEGTVVTDTDGPDLFDVHQAEVLVSDGKLTITTASGGSNAKFAFIHITPVRIERMVQIQTSSGEETWLVSPDHGIQSFSGPTNIFKELDAHETYELTIPVPEEAGPEANG